MSLLIYKFVIGPLRNNTYLVVDQNTKKTAVIDPALGSSAIADLVKEKYFDVAGIWLTHGHFDHFYGVQEFIDHLGANPVVAIHSKDLILWKNAGASTNFGYTIEPGPEPGILLSDNQVITLGDSEIKVIHTPGHTPGHVVFYSEEDQVVFCGDLIFKSSIGRPDNDRNSLEQIVNSIKERIFSLPDDSRLLPGHGPETSIIEEKLGNPFLI